MHTFTYRSGFAVPPEVLWQAHSRPEALRRWTPPWRRVSFIDLPRAPVDGAELQLRLHAGPLARTWHGRIRDVVEGREFTDVQLRGPFAAWEHTHRCLPAADGASILEDQVRFRLPGGLLAAPCAGWVERQLRRDFAFRHERLRLDLQRYGSAAPGKGRIVVITGIHGLLGRNLATLLRWLGFAVRGLTRTPRAAGDFAWDPGGAGADPQVWRAAWAVVHLAGANIAEGRWTAARKAELRHSRVAATEQLTRQLAALAAPPPVLLAASGAHVHADGFLGALCRDWEAAAEPARQAGIRVTHLRTAMVLTPEGGALAKMLPAFLCGCGGRLGSGRQATPWIGIDDWLDLSVRALVDASLAGPLWLAAPEAVDNAAFTRVLARVLRRPAVMPAPAAALRLLFGEMADAMLLGEAPDMGPPPADYSFRHPELATALRSLLGRHAGRDG
jgi:hypothetical protein